MTSGARSNTMEHRVTTHLGRDIFYTEDGQTPHFFVKGRDGNPAFSYRTLASVIEALNIRAENKKAPKVAAFERIDVFETDYDGIIRWGVLTSISEDSDRRGWVLWTSGRRTKESLEHLMVKTAANLAIVKRAGAMNKKAEALSRMAEKLLRTPLFAKKFLKARSRRAVKK